MYDQIKEMRATAIFASFFLLSTTTSIAVPIPLFPGNMIPTLFRAIPSEYIPYLEALANGITYGFVILIVFVFVDKKLEQMLSMDF